MAVGLHHAGDFIVDKLLLVTTSGLEVDLINSVMAITLFEDISSMTITGTIAIMDSVNLAALGLASYGFIYDEEFGDEEEGFPPGTRIKDIDDNWLCPDCGTTKDMFVEVEK